MLAFFVFVAWVFLGIRVVEYRASSQDNASVRPTISPVPETSSPNAASAIPKPISPTTEPISPISPDAESEFISSYKQIEEWDGTGRKTTENFVITEAPWIIVWSFEPRKKPGEGLSMLQIYVRQPENAEYNKLPVHIGNAQDTRQGSHYIHDVGKYYLRVYSQSGGWHIKVLVKK